MRSTDSASSMDSGATQSTTLSYTLSPPMSGGQFNQHTGDFPRTEGAAQEMVNLTYRSPLLLGRKYIDYRVSSVRKEEVIDHFYDVPGGETSLDNMSQGIQRPPPDPPIQGTQPGQRDPPVQGDQGSRQVQDAAVISTASVNSNPGCVCTNILLHAEPDWGKQHQGFSAHHSTAGGHHGALQWL